MESHGPGRIGIIGSGIAGSSAAYFLRQELGETVQIVVFEQAAQAGGRIQELQIDGEQVELGASIFHSRNRHLVHFVEILGLHQQRTDTTGTLGIWNGLAFDLKSFSAQLTSMQLLLRYGWTLIRTQGLVKEAMTLLDKAYASQKNAFQEVQSPEAFLTDLGLYPLTQKSSNEFFRSHGMSERFLREFVDGASRNNYGQDGDINALVNLVSLAGTGMAGGYLCSVQEGNQQICQGLLRVSRTSVRTSCRVQQVTRPRSEDDGYLLELENGESEHFDAVIIAAPLEGAAITFQNINLPASASLRRPYQVTHVTLVVGSLNPAWFGMKRRKDLPDFILTTENPAIPFSSLEAIARKHVPQRTIYKLFSRDPVGEEILAKLFDERMQTEYKQWHAYPVLKPMSQWPPFQISRNLYYVNAMESAVSTMETEAIASRYVVNLLKQAY